MAIVIDYSQVAYSIVGQEASKTKTGDLEVDLVRHMILNVIRSYNHKFRNQYGQLYLACDAKSSWRHRQFQHYKASRKKNREESDIDWEAIFAAIGDLSHDIKAHFPIGVIKQSGAEADDIIGIMANQATSNDPLMIVSGDKDFRQLHRSCVRQFAPVQKADIIVDNPSLYLAEQILRGDTGDGIPSMLCKDDHIVDEDSGRAPAITKGVVEEYMSYWDEGNSIIDENFFSAIDKGKVWQKLVAKQKFTGSLMEERYLRNKTLIDLRHTPTEITKDVLQQLSNPVENNLVSAMQYFAQNKMNVLMDYVDDFMPPVF